MEDNKLKYTTIISDVHGTIEEFNELIDILNNKYPGIRIILSGDLISRGPDSVGVVRRARELNLESVKGNHEERFLKWYYSQGTNISNIYDSKSFYKDFSSEDIIYMQNMPLYIELDDAIIVHAGLKPGVPILEQKKEDLLYLRYTDENRKFISLKTISKKGIKESGAVFWTEFGPFCNKSVIYGHSVVEEPRIDYYDNGTVAYGIDTGCCFGGKLTALIWETKEFVQVKAKKVYHKSDLLIW